MDPQKHLAKLPTARSPQTVKTNLGVYHIKGMLSLREQQQVVETVRAWCIREPQKYKFSRSEVLAEQEQQKREDNDSFDYLETNDALKGRHE